MTEMQPILADDPAAAAAAAEPAPLMEDDTQTVQLLTDLAEESRTERAPWVRIADQSLEIYTWGSLDYAEDKLIVPEIRNAVDAITQIQTSEPPKIDLEPVETGETGQVYWNGPAEVGLGLGLPPEFTVPQAGLDGAVQPPMPLPEEFADVLRDFVAAGQLKDDWLVEVDDKLVADTYQTVFDVMWRRSLLPLWYESTVKKTNVIGWGWSLYEFHDDEKRSRLRTLSVRQVYVDPTVDSLDEATYAGVDLNLDATEAKRIWPHLAGRIEQEADTGQPRTEDGTDDLGQALSRDFKRKRVTLRVFWLRNQPDPASLPVEGAEPRGEGPTAPLPRVLREVMVVAGVKVQDRICEHADIPLLHNVSNDVPNTPFGVGDPWLLRTLQDADNVLLDSMVEHSKWFKYPVLAISESMAAILGDDYKKAYIEPGRTLIIPDEQYNLSGGKLHTVMDPPQTPPAMVQLHDVLRNAINQSSGHTNELRGVQSSSQQSGKAIALLQSGATSKMTGRARRTGHMLERLARLMNHCHVHRLTLDDVALIVSKYPPHILAAIVGRAQRMEWDVKVEVSSGSEAVRAAKKQEAREDVAMGAMSLETYCEIAGLDFREEQEKTRHMLQDQMRMQASLGMGQQGGEGGGEGGGEQPGGGGQESSQ